MRSEENVKGHAHYLLRLNDYVRRSASERWARARPPWSHYDGLVRVTDATRPFLQSQRLGARPYSVSALQNYAYCPYRFLLSAMYHLEPLEDPEPLERMDPLTKGSLFHEVLAEFFRALQQRQMAMATTPMDRVLEILDATLTRVAANYAELLAPAVDRVWQDEVAGIRTDLHIWARDLAESTGWEPWLFEFGFGLPDAPGRDPNSRREPVTIDNRFLLRGAIDLIERKPGTKILRVTDHKTSKNRSERGSIIGHGQQLQPVIYSLAVEAATGCTVESARFSYCTTAGGFTEHNVPINERSRDMGIEALEIIDRAVELGMLPPAPAEKACGVLRLPAGVRSEPGATGATQITRSDRRSDRVERTTMRPALADQADREQIATALDDTLIVEAAAGTGKTTELVRRIVRVIETGRAEVTGIVAVTFTEKAAGELKLRLREALEEARGNSASGSAQRERLDRALGRLEEAQVSTIHGFCADLLRERPVEARIDPLFTVLTEAQAERMYDEAFHHVAGKPACRSVRRREALAAPPDLRRFWCSSGGRRRPIDRLRRAGWELIQWRDFDGDWQRPPFDRASRIDELVQLLNGFTDLLEPPGDAHDTLYADSWAARKLADEIRRTESVATRDYDRLEAGLIELSRNRNFKDARKGSGKNYRSGVLRDDVWRARRKPAERSGRFRGGRQCRSCRGAARRTARLRACV